MHRDNQIHLFAGPTLHRLEWVREMVGSSVILKPPAIRGDIENLCSEVEPGSMAIVDGAFYQSVAVGHAEIRKAIDAGWAIWGLSSMGAIRAYEMRQHGIVGFGRIYDMFFETEDFQDDEVSLIHEMEAPYRPVSEPLVHMREAVMLLIRLDLLSESRAAQIVDELKKQWFGDRTWSGFLAHVMEGADPKNRARVLKLIESPDDYQVKSFDLADFLRVRPWRTAYHIENPRARSEHVAQSQSWFPRHFASSGADVLSSA